MRSSAVYCNEVWLADPKHFYNILIMWMDSYCQVLLFDLASMYSFPGNSLQKNCPLCTFYTQNSTLWYNRWHYERENAVNSERFTFWELVYLDIWMWRIIILLYFLSLVMPPWYVKQGDLDQFNDLTQDSPETSIINIELVNIFLIPSEDNIIHQV